MPNRQGEDNMSDRMMVPIESIEVSASALRGPQTQTEDFQNLTKSIENEGIFNNLVVRESTTAEGMYTLIDGLQRYTVATLIGLKELPVVVMPADEQRALMIQMQANLHTVSTKPAEYAKQLVRILRLEPELTIAALAARLSVNPDWIKTRLSLLKLHPDIQKLVDNGTLILSNARMLASLDPEEQAEWLSRAVNDPASAFLTDIKKHIQEKRKAAREGAEAPEAVFEASPRLRTKGEIQTEIKEAQACGAMLTKDMTAAQAWKLALQWSVRLDPQTVSESQAKWEAEKAARDARKKENAEARAAARAAKAAEVEKDLL